MGRKRARGRNKRESRDLVIDLAKWEMAAKIGLASMPGVVADQTAADYPRRIIRLPN